VAELEAMSAEALPDRKAMSTIGSDPSEFADVTGAELIPPPAEGDEQRRRSSRAPAPRTQPANRRYEP
jgi:hypothetical protein